MNAQNLSIQGLYPKDELNLYLVLNGLKPATHLHLDPTYINGKKHIERTDSEGILKVFTEEINLTKEEIQEFRKTLLLHNILYNKREDCIIIIEPNALGTRTKAQGEAYFVAKDKPALERLVKSWTDFNDYERGLALGYPEMASKYFKQEFNGNFVDGGYWIDSIKNAIKTNTNIPTWLGYLSHVPIKINIVTNTYSKESEEQGKLYESFVRENNPWLATKVDAKFKVQIAAQKKAVEKEQLNNN
jgi:hypothetical protein